MLGTTDINDVILYTNYTEPPKMIYIIKDLKNAIESNKNTSIVADSIQRLTNYVRIYFSTEEQMMNRYNYPDRKKHITEHKILSRQLNEYANRYNKSNSVTPNELLVFVNTWFDHHVLVTDKKLGEYLSNGKKEDINCMCL